MARACGTLLLAIGCCLTHTRGHAAEADTSAPPDGHGVLRTRGRDIVDGRGHVVTLRGVNVGGWAAFNYDASMRYDLSSDSYESLMEKWIHGLVQWQDPEQPKNSWINPWWVDGFRQRWPSGPPR